MQSLLKQPRVQGIKSRQRSSLVRVEAAMGSRLDPSNPNIVNMKVTHNIDVPIVGQSLEPGSRISDYMTLPVSQFVLVDLPMGARMDRLDDRGTFRLVIPRLELLNLWLEPSFEVMVQLKEVDGRMCVALKSGRVDVRGPSWIDNVQERIFFVGETQMFWDEGPQPKIISKTVIEARADPPAPVNMLPRQVIATAVETVITGMVAVLQKPFVEQILADYRKWAADPAYRERRRAMGEAQTSAVMASFD